MKNIYLIGMRGVGKTTIGKLLATKLQRTFFDMDEWIRQEEGMAIAELVKKKGWSYFRDKEREAVNILSKKEHAIISTGGGVLQYFDNAEKLKKTGKLIHLTASVATLENRLRMQTERPSITGIDPVDELEALWESRKVIYERNADLTIDTEGKLVEQIGEEIEAWISSPSSALVKNRKGV